MPTPETHQPALRRALGPWTTVAIIMGTAVQYDIGEVVDGDLHVVARFPKRLLDMLSP